MTSTTTIQRPALAGQVAGALGSFAAFLREHPGLPVDENHATEFHVRAATDEAARAEIDRIAAILGVTAEHSDRGHHTAARRFGPGVTYQATAIDRKAMDRYNAHMAPYHAAELAIVAGTEAAA